jgi:putative DNA primase/helicase
MAPEQIEAWWRCWPNANVGVATGAVSGIWVLDVDPDKGGDRSLAEFEALFETLGPTWRVETGGGGLHYWFRAPGEPLRSNAGRLGPGLDVRADGGYVVAPPSRHRSGHAYRWDEPSCPTRAPILQAPRWLLDLLREEPRQKMVPPERAAGGRIGRGNHSRELPTSIPEGERNTVLMRFGGAMRRYGFGDDAIRAALLIENAVRCVPALPEEEVAQIARSVARYAPTKDLARMPTRSQPRGFVEFVAGKAVQR